MACTYETPVPEPKRLFSLRIQIISNYVKWFGSDLD